MLKLEILLSRVRPHCLYIHMLYAFNFVWQRWCKLMWHSDNSPPFLLNSQAWTKYLVILFFKKKKNCGLDFLLVAIIYFYYYLKLLPRVWTTHLLICLIPLTLRVSYTNFTLAVDVDSHSSCKSGDGPRDHRLVARKQEAQCKVNIFFYGNFDSTWFHRIVFCNYLDWLHSLFCNFNKIYFNPNYHCLVYLC